MPCPELAWKPGLVHARFSGSGAPPPPRSTARATKAIVLLSHGTKKAIHTHNSHFLPLPRTGPWLLPVPTEMSRQCQALRGEVEIRGRQREEEARGLREQLGRIPVP